MNCHYLKGCLACLLFSAFIMHGCRKADSEFPTGGNNTRELPANLQNKEAEFFILVKGKQLVKFSLQNLDMPSAPIILDGMESGEIILAIDFRPATGQLYALGSTSRLYEVNPGSGYARLVGSGPFSPALEGTLSGFDFNPTVDRIRVVTSSGQNLRLNPETGTVVMRDGDINGAPGASITSVAYTNNKSGATSTILYDIDVVNKKLYKQDPPNNGTLVLVGNLDANITGEGGFDIGPDGAVALAAYGKKIYSVNLETGKATSLGDWANYDDITGLAIRTEPVAYAIDEANNLLIFNPMNPVPVMKAITGTSMGVTLEGIDFRPVNGQLFALGSDSRLYTLNTSNGAATMVGTMPFSPLLSGSSFGFDFNPTVDRIRVVSDMGQNLRLNPLTGTVAGEDMKINPAGSTITQVAYTNNFAGSTATVLYDIDAATNKLFKQDPPNNGTLVEVGSLDIDVSQSGGFDIGGASGKAYAILPVGAGVSIYSINLTNGKATMIAPFPKQVKGFAVGLGF